MDEFLEIRKKAIENYTPKDNTVSDRMQEVKGIATEIYEKIRQEFRNQALDPNNPFLYFEYRNSDRFSSYDSEYVRGLPSRKTLVMVVLQEMCENKGIRFIHDTSHRDGELNWQFLKILPTYASTKGRVLNHM